MDEAKVKEIVKNCKLTMEEKHDMDKKWGESSPGIGGINYCEHEVLSKVAHAIRQLNDDKEFKEALNDRQD